MIRRHDHPYSPSSSKAKQHARGFHYYCFYHYFWWIGFACTLIGNVVMLLSSHHHHHHDVIAHDHPTTLLRSSSSTTTTTSDSSIGQIELIHADTLIEKPDGMEAQFATLPVQKKSSSSAVDIKNSPPKSHSSSSSSSTNTNIAADASDRRRPGEKKDVSSSSSSYDHTFSFCLLIKDDNDLLNEWIAYHYHVLNLRHVIVAVDPSSQTESPKFILDNWKLHFDIDTQFTFEIWNDQDFMPSFFLNGDYENVPRMIKIEDKNATKWQEEGEEDIVDEAHLKEDYQRINNHRYRQAKFLQKCSKTLQDQKKTWMTHIDTDEYIVLNPKIRRKSSFETKNFIDQPLLPKHGGLGKNSLWNLLEDLYTRDPATINWPCLSMPRVLYGSVVDDNDNDSATSLSSLPLETLRWKYHADYNDDERNKQPKVIMDVSGFPPFNTSKKAFSIHRPNLRLCRGRGNIHLEDSYNYPLTVNHYVGSLDRYLAREDPRRTKRAYYQKSNVQEGGKDDDWIDTWWTSFIKEYGREKVSKVLGNAISMMPAAATTTTGGVADADDKDNPTALGPILPLKDDQFSACLLVKDDNDILNEWIAYHYHVLKLRTLVMATDPSSVTSPEVVLNRWESIMDIQLWNDQDFMPDFFLQGKFDLVPNLIGNMTNSTTSQFHNNHMDEDKDVDSGKKQEIFIDEETVKQDLIQVNNHRFRQNRFFQSCIQHLKERNMTWMTHVDTDEYIVMQHRVRKQDHWRKEEIQPEIGPASILKFLKMAAAKYAKGISYPCISMPRLLFGSKEDDDLLLLPDGHSDATTPGVLPPPPFNATKFETLRWKYHSDYDNDMVKNGRPKVIMDLSGLPPKANFLNPSKGVFSIHRPGLFMCRKDTQVLFNVSHKFPITINHYIGSWERYSSRDDARRSRATYNVKGSVAAGKDDNWIDGWVASFVKEMGLEQAKRLLAEYTTEGHSSSTTTTTTNDFKFPPDDKTTEEGDDTVQQEGAVVASSKNNKKTKPPQLEEFLDTSSSNNRMEFSACLLTKDDNDILDEWIAYHYHVLGLRYMIVAVDAKSVTSPGAILEKWRAVGMTIEEWKDETFMPASYFEKAYHLQPRLVKIKKNKHKWLEGNTDPQVEKEYINSIQDHRFRQIVFVSECTKRLREQDRTWMIHIDTDEYIVINPKLRELKRFNGTINVPSKVEASVVPRLLNQMVVSNWDDLNYPCVSLPRLLFGSVEDDHQPSIPQEFNASRFETVRWKYHADFEDGALNKQPKVIMDVSAIPQDDKMLTEGRVFSIHRPSQYLCRTQGQMYFDDVDFFPFSVNHYLGTFERFDSRNDLRRNRKLYDQKANVRAGKDGDDWIDSWLDSFVQDVGKDKAWKLLGGYLKE